jgi:ABC-type dipeptide/oligopeptide/nickel transport system permease subunit
MKRAAIGFLILLSLGIAWRFFFPETGEVSHLDLALVGPSGDAWLGRDSLGRDLLARILQGAQVSIGLGLLSSLLALILGIGYGSVSALAPKLIDSVLMRFSEICMSLPSLMLMAVLALILQMQLPSAPVLVLLGAMVLSQWMPAARLSRNLIRQEASREYVVAARALGASPQRIFCVHIARNLFSPLLVYWSLQVPHAIISEGILSFLGVGLKSPTVSWGALMQEGWRTLASFPHLLWGPSLILFLTVLSINTLLETLRKNIYPKLKWQKID